MLGDAQLATLIVRTADGDRAAFRLLYDHTAGWLLAVALRILGQHDLAEEAMQDTFVSVWKEAGRFDPARARGWMSTLARRCAIDRLRASPWLSRECPEPEEIEDTINRLPESLALRQCLERLDDRTRWAVCLAYLHGLTHSELSGRTGIPLGTIKSRLRRGVQSLKERLDQ